MTLDAHTPSSYPLLNERRISVLDITGDRSPEGIITDYCSTRKIAEPDIKHAIAALNASRIAVPDERAAIASLREARIAVPDEAAAIAELTAGGVTVLNLSGALSSLEDNHTAIPNLFDLEGIRRFHAVIDRGNETPVRAVLIVQDQIELAAGHRPEDNVITYCLVSGDSPQTPVRMEPEYVSHVLRVLEENMYEIADTVRLYQIGLMRTDKDNYEHAYELHNILGPVRYPKMDGPVTSISGGVDFSHMQGLQLPNYVRFFGDVILRNTGIVHVPHMITVDGQVTVDISSETGGEPADLTVSGGRAAEINNRIDACLKALKIGADYNAAITAMDQAHTENANRDASTSAPSRPSPSRPSRP